jgi:hypothetical protein
LRKATISYVMSICLPVCLSAWNNSVSSGRILMKFHVWDFFEEMFQVHVVQKIKAHILCSMIFFRKCAVYEIMSKNMMKPERTQVIWRLLASTRQRSCTHPPPPPRAHTHTYARRHARIRMHSPIRARTHTYIILISFHGNSDFMNAPQYFATRTLPVLVILYTFTQYHVKYWWKWKRNCNREERTVYHVTNLML